MGRRIDEVSHRGRRSGLPKLGAVRHQRVTRVAPPEVGVASHLVLSVIRVVPRRKRVVSHLRAMRAVVANLRRPRKRNLREAVVADPLEVIVVSPRIAMQADPRKVVVVGLRRVVRVDLRNHAVVAPQRAAVDPRAAEVDLQEVVVVSRLKVTRVRLLKVVVVNLRKAMRVDLRRAAAVDPQGATRVDLRKAVAVDRQGATRVDLRRAVAVDPRGATRVVRQGVVGRRDPLGLVKAVEVDLQGAAVDLPVEADRIEAAVALQRAKRRDRQEVDLVVSLGHHPHRPNQR